MANFADRYGIPAHEVDNLSSRFKRNKLKETFGSFDNFLKFCAEQGYQPGMGMYRYYPNEPHSPENTFFHARPNKPEPKAKPEKPEQKDICSTFCKKKKCDASGAGCAEYKKRWAENWNKNIHRKITESKVPNRTMVFRYEHPDLIREGIVFEGSGSM